jgi:hypothetical protein
MGLESKSEERIGRLSEYIECLQSNDDPLNMLLDTQRLVNRNYRKHYGSYNVGLALKTSKTLEKPNDNMTPQCPKKIK